MNILYISSKKGWPGIVSWMVLTALGLQNRGHHVQILAHPKSMLVNKRPQGLKIISKSLGFDYNPLVIVYLMKLIRKQAIDIVVTNIQKEVIVGGICAKICGIKNVRRIGTHHDLSGKVFFTQTRLVDHSIIPCNAVFEKALANASWLKRADFTTIYNGRNVRNISAADRQKIRNSWQIGEEDLVIGSTSSITKVKGIDTLIKVFAEINSIHPATKLVITGEGPEMENLKKLSRTLNLTKSIIFNGFASDPVKIAAAYDIAVLNSKLEGFPNAIVEYFSAGCAVIATNIDGVPEIIQDLENGLLINPGDHEQLKNTIIKLLKNPQLRAKLGRNALTTVRDHFSEEQMLDNLERLFWNITKTNV